MKNSTEQMRESEELDEDREFTPRRVRQSGPCVCGTCEGCHARGHVFEIDPEAKKSTQEW